MTVSELYNYLKANLSEMFCNVDERLAFARRLFTCITGYSQQEVVLNPGREAGASDAIVFDIMHRVHTGEPLEYIFNSAQFLDLDLKTNGCVLIPRPETEELVLMVLRHLEGSGDAARVLDIGTGSGCIPVYLCSKYPKAEYWACDVSKAALAAANTNASEADCKINLLECDILRWEDCAELCGRRFDVIVSNPPYVLDSEKALMRGNVLDFEPHNALFVPDSDPLLFYRRICEYAASHLNAGGRLFFEINERFGKETATLMQDCGFGDVRVVVDLFRKDRFVTGVLISI